MRAFLDFLRRLIALAITAAIILLLSRYVLDYPAVASRDSISLGRLVKLLTNPALSKVGALIGMPGQPGPWSPLPLGLSVALIILGAVVGSVFDLMNRLLLRTPRSTAAAPAVLTVTPPVQVSAPAGRTVAPFTNAMTATASTEQTVLNSAKPGAALPAAGRVEHIGRYEILEELGRGAMGVVYKAKDPQIGRVVAIKSLLGALGADPSADEFRKRFISEARAAGRLNHPGIMKVHDIIDDANGQPCLVLEFIEGQTLNNFVATEHPPLDRCLDILIQCARALGYAHANGVIHRDIKPANIMVARDGHTTISDFGIAKIEDTQMTATGAIMGTPAFMSPEQVSGIPVDHTTDIFSLGSVLYWLCTGKRPFTGETFAPVSYHVVNTAPDAILQVNSLLPAALGPVVERCLAKTPKERYPSAYDLATDLEAIRAALASGPKQAV